MTEIDIIQRKHFDPLSPWIDSMTLALDAVKRFLKDGESNQLLEKIKVQEALGSPCPFWEEDLQAIKPIVLRSIVTGA